MHNSPMRPSVVSSAQTYLCVCQHADDCAVLLERLQLRLDGGLALRILLAVLGERLLLGLVPDSTEQGQEEKGGSARPCD